MHHVEPMIVVNVKQGETETTPFLAIGIRIIIASDLIRVVETNLLFQNRRRNAARPIQVQYRDLVRL
ncbi:MAG: hypothetical protein ACRCX8_18800 [Sarcina sp.]